MTSMREGKDQPGLTLCLGTQFQIFGSHELRSSLIAAWELMTSQGLSPNVYTISRKFPANQKRIAKSTRTKICSPTYPWDGVSSLTLTRASDLDGKEIRTFKKESASFFMHRSVTGADANHWFHGMHFWIMPDLSNGDEKVLMAALQDFASAHVTSFGCIIRMQDAADAASCARGGPPMFTPVQDEHERENTMGWTPNDGSFKQVMLWNIYRVNLLTNEYLKLPVGRSTLVQWIKAKPSSRGELERLNDHVTAWSIDPNLIPTIREELFRAGIVYYYRFFQTFDPKNTWARDFARPFRCPTEIPSIFRSDYRQATDQ